MRRLNGFSPQRLHGWWRTLALLLVSLALGSAQAQSTPDDATDPPDRVARLSFLDGDVGMLPAGATAWSDAALNRPFTTGDRLSTAQGARAELEFGGSSLYLDGDTDLGLLELSDRMAQLELTQGTVRLGVRALDAGRSVEVDTPTVALVLDDPATIRVDIARGGSGTRVSVLDGRVTAYGANDAQRTLVAGRVYEINDATLAQVSISEPGPGDAFDAWAAAREQRYARVDTTRYVPDDMVGAQDLAAYGDWQTDDAYGPVWYPTQVDPGWAPYAYGNWSYIAPWGWTWVDAAPWGFAPYHYGRWASIHGRWGWIPGPLGVRPVYAPALVAFVGGGGWSVGIGSGPVGWFPLGPGEIYNPWYRVSRRYYTSVNVTNIYVGRRGDRARFDRDIDTHWNHYRSDTRVPGMRYANRNAPRGFTAVSGRTFAGGQAIRGTRAGDERGALSTTQVLPRGIAARAPGGMTPPARSAHVRNLPVRGFDREVVARHAPDARVRDLAGARPNGAEGRVDTPRLRMTPPDAARPLNAAADADRREPGARGPGVRGADQVRPFTRRVGSDRPAGAPQVVERTAGAAPVRGPAARPDAGMDALPSSRYAGEARGARRFRRDAGSAPDATRGFRGDAGSASEVARQPDAMRSWRTAPRVDGAAPAAPRDTDGSPRFESNAFRGRPDATGAPERMERARSVRTPDTARPQDMPQLRQFPRAQGPRQGVERQRPQSYGQPPAAAPAWRNPPRAESAPRMAPPAMRAEPRARPQRNEGREQPARSLNQRRRGDGQQQP